MIPAGYLSPDLVALARDGSAAHRIARRANALVLFDDGWNCERVAVALLLDDDPFGAGMACSFRKVASASSRCAGVVAG
jgi:hypothetical protein